MRSVILTGICFALLASVVDTTRGSYRLFVTIETVQLQQVLALVANPVPDRKIVLLLCDVVVFDRRPQHLFAFHIDFFFLIKTLLAALHSMGRREKFLACAEAEKAMDNK